MALFEPRAFDVQLDPARIRAGEAIRGQIVARKAMSVSAFQMVLTQNDANVALVEVPAPGRLGKGEVLNFEVPTPATAAPSMTTDPFAVDWCLLVTKGTEGMRLSKSIDVSIGSVRQQFDLNGFEHPEVLRVARNWQKLTSGSPFTLNWTELKAEATGQNRHLVPAVLNAGLVLEAPIVQWLGEPVSVVVRPGSRPVSLGLICTLFKTADRESNHLESFILHEEWHEIVANTSVDVRLPRRGAPSYGAGYSAVHWTLEARGPNQELIERRPLCALAGPDFDERLIDHRPNPALGRV